MFEVEIEFTDSFHNKTNTEHYMDALQEALEYMGNEFLNALKDEAPVRTGRLRDGHYMNVSKDTVSIGNNVEYASYVIYGTSRQAPNNYPSRVASRMGVFVESSMSVFESSLITRGVL